MPDECHFGRKAVIWLVVGFCATASKAAIQWREYGLSRTVSCPGPSMLPRLSMSAFSNHWELLTGGT